MAISLLAVLARQESVRRSERATAAYARLKAQGRTDHLGRKRLVLDRSKVRDMAAGGLSTREIAKKFRVSHTSIAPSIPPRSTESVVAIQQLGECVSASVRLPLLDLQYGALRLDPTVERLSSGAAV
jgi:DNA invertase Pin-like site-specific DNA recombinase